MRSDAPGIALAYASGMCVSNAPENTTDGRTDALTKNTSTQSFFSPNASRVERHNESISSGAKP